MPTFGRYPRARADLPAECTVHGVTFPAHILVLGGGGLLLGVAQQLLPHTELKVRFRPANYLPVVEATASVRYQLPDQGTGVEFKEIKPEDRQTILRVVLHRFSQKPRYPRKTFVTQVENEAGTFLGFSRDISVGGMFIETKTPFPEGSVVKLRFHLDDGGPIVPVDAEVRYMMDKLCMGVAFIDLSPSDRNRIETYVTKVEGGA
jgi:uncharacterized protein (TIGR02266 family)